MYIAVGMGHTFLLRCVNVPVHKIMSKKKCFTKSGVEEPTGKSPEQSLDLNTFGTNCNSDCEPDPTTKQQSDLTDAHD